MKNTLIGLPGDYVVIWHNGEIDVCDMTFEETVAYVKQDKRYANYGHNGATIIEYKKLYTIECKTVEETFV